MMAVLQAPAPLYFSVAVFAILHGVAVRRHRRDWLHPCRVLTLLYLTLSLASLAFTEDLAPAFEIHLNWLTVAGYTLLLTIGLLPSFFIHRPLAESVSNDPFVPLLIRWSWPLVFFSFAFLTPFARDSLLQGFSTTRIALSSGGNVLDVGPLTTVAVATASYYVLFAILLLAAMVRRANAFALLSMSVGVALALLHAAVFAARDGALWAVQALLLAYWVFKPRLRPGSVRAFRLCVGAGALVGLLYMAVGTYDRFSAVAGGYRSGTIGYFGAQPYVFAETVARLTDFYGLSLRFPVLAALGNRVEIVRVETFQWSFGTYLSDFYSVSGWVSAIGLSALLCVSTVGLLRMGRRSGFSYILVVALYTQFMVQGMFYFRLGNQAGNLYHLSMIVLVVVAALRRRDAAHPASAPRSET